MQHYSARRVAEWLTFANQLKYADSAIRFNGLSLPPIGDFVFHGEAAQRAPSRNGCEN